MLSRFSGIVFGLVCVSVSASGQYVISTYAGNNTQGYAGDGGPPAAAVLNLPAGMVYSNGSLYIADTSNHCVRVISGGIITTFAGMCGNPGFGGDGGPAIGAELNNPSGVAVDQNGDVLIADSGNNVVRIVVPSGIISTFAGDHSQAPGFTGDGGLATSGTLENPTAVAVDTAGNVYITDPVNNVIRKVNAVPQCTTLNGTTTCGDYFSTAVGIAASSGVLDAPNGVAVDSNFSIYVSDASHRVFKYANGALSVFAGTGNIADGAHVGDNGPAIKAVLNNPIGLAVDAAGNVYITDANEAVVRVVAPNGIITSIAGSGQFGYSGDGGPALNANMMFPHMAIPDGQGNIYIADTQNNVIRMLTIPSPVITANKVVNGASFQPKIAPGSLASIFGTNLATSTTPGAAAPLPTVLAEAAVTVNGKAAPILYASPTQINFQMPWETAVGNASIVVSVDGTASNTATVPVTATAPGIFTSSGAAVAQNSDYSLNTPSNPAHAGSFLIAYLTGSGAVTPSVPDGAATPSTGLVQIPSNVTVSATIGGQSAPVLFAGLSPDFVSLVQLDITVPSGLAAGNYPLIVTIGGQVSNSATVSIAP
ncbi:MAG: IPT/TIG domain-containing protein [Bryobacteraceae bacterium]